MSPVVPGFSGNGLAIRSGLVLQQLTRRYEVSLLVAPFHGPVTASIDTQIEGLCRAVHVASTTPSPTLGSLTIAARRLGATATTTPEPAAFSAVHLYRLTTLPLAEPYLARVEPFARSIDIDEVESATRYRLADSYLVRGDARARFLRVEASAYSRIEREVLKVFGRVYVCSPRERELLSSGHDPGNVRVLPNALPDLPPLGAPPACGLFTLLFVGTMAYAANAEALEYFCLEVLPILRRSVARAFRVVAVGAGASPALRALAARQGVEMPGAVADVVEYYRDAHAVVAPLRTGGGTRLKVIEAMRAARPIVATTEGVAGLALEPDTHVLIGDTAETFARQCVRLMEEPRVARSLSREARAVYERNHRPAVMAAVLAPDTTPDLGAASELARHHGPVVGASS